MRSFLLDNANICPRTIHERTASLLHACPRIEQLAGLTSQCSVGPSSPKKRTGPQGSGAARFCGEFQPTNRPTRRSTASQHAARWHAALPHEMGLLRRDRGDGQQAVGSGVTFVLARGSACSRLNGRRVVRESVSTGPSGPVIGYRPENELGSRSKNSAFPHEQYSPQRFSAPIRRFRAVPHRVCLYSRRGPRDTGKVPFNAVLTASVWLHLFAAQLHCVHEGTRL